MKDEPLIIPNLRAMNPTLRVNCSVLAIAENSPDIKKIKELGAKHKIKIEVGCGNVPSQAPAVIEIMPHGDPQMDTLWKKAGEANTARASGYLLSHGAAVEARAKYDEARREARATAVQAVNDSGIADILNSLQIRLIDKRHIEAPLTVQVVEVSNPTNVPPRARH
jgi:hypothetical protein